VADTKTVKNIIYKNRNLKILLDMKSKNLFLISLFSVIFSFFTVSGNVYAQEAEILLSETEKTQAEDFSSEEITTVKREWFIYYKKATKVTAGPFDTVEEAINAWLDNPKIKAKGKYYIGRDGRMYTNDPESYYRKRYESVLRERNLTEAQEQREQKAREEAELKKLLKPEEQIQTPKEPLVKTNDVQEDAVSENGEEKPFTKKEQRAKEKAEKKAEKERIAAEKKAEKERIAAEKKAEKERKKKGYTDEVPEGEEPFTTDETVTEETVPQSKTAEVPSEETFVFTPDSPADSSEKTIEFTLDNDLFSSDRYSKSYLSDYIAKDIFTIPDSAESDLESEFKDFYDEPDSKGVTSLMKAVREGNDWKIRTLLKSGSDVNAKDRDGWTPLMYAVRYQSNLNVVNLLLEQKADVKAQNNYSLSALVLASCFNDNPDVIKKLLSYYSPSDKEVQKAFVQLISTQQTDNFALISKITLFLDFGLPVNSYYDGKTPLMYACKYCTTTKAIKLLLDKNASLTVRSTEGKTAFDYAQENKNLIKDDIYWSLNKR